MFVSKTKLIYIVLMAHGIAEPERLKLYNWTEEMRVRVRKGIDVDENLSFKNFLTEIFKRFESILSNC